MDITPLITAFGIITVAELGDKTQLAAIALSTTYRAAVVFIGALFAVALVDGISILAGVALADFVPMMWVSLVGAVIFIGFGAYTLISKDAGRMKVKRGKSAILTSFSIISVMELGDKTQLAIIPIAARCGSPVLVFIGMILAFIVLMGAGVILGSRLKKYLPRRYLKIFTGVLFLIFGAIFLLSAVGITPP